MEKEINAERLLSEIDQLANDGWATKAEKQSAILIRSLLSRISELESRVGKGEKPGKKSIKDPTPGFAAFWDAWPSGPRKVNKKNCLARWVRAELERHSDEIVNHVEACKLSQDWTKDDGAFIPAPLVYLNQERFLAPPPKPAAANKKAGSLSGIQYTTEGIDHDGHFA